MPTRPKVKQFAATSADVLNAIRNSASVNYKDYVPVATEDAASVKEIGAVIMQYPTLQNEFLTNLVNRIGRVIITSRMYSNPLAFAKKGFLDMGETVEELFVQIAKPYEYDAEKAEQKVFKREIPDVRAAFHVLNFQKFYKVTIQQEQLRQAFLSWDGVDNLIAKITDSLYSGAAYDEYTMTKYLLAKKILMGQMYPIEVGTARDTATLKADAAVMRSTSNQLEFMSPKYNLAGVTTNTLKDNQYIYIDADFDAAFDVEVLASAFNMSKAEFLGHRVLVDGFGNFDDERLNELMTDQDGNYINNYTPLTAAEKQALASVPAVICDVDFTQIYDVLQQFTEQFNGEGMYWNYWLHVWKIFSASPFSNAIVFTPTAPSVSRVTVSPATAVVHKGQKVQLTADVTTAGFASKAVNWSVTSGNATVTNTGLVTVNANAADNSKVRIKATSVFDSTESATAELTVDPTTNI